MRDEIVFVMTNLDVISVAIAIVTAFIKTRRRRFSNRRSVYDIIWGELLFYGVGLMMLWAATFHTFFKSRRTIDRPGAEPLPMGTGSGRIWDGTHRHTRATVGLLDATRRHARVRGIQLRCGSAAHPSDRLLRTEGSRSRRLPAGRALRLADLAEVAVDVSRFS